MELLKILSSEAFLIQMPKFITQEVEHMKKIPPSRKWNWYCPLYSCEVQNTVMFKGPNTMPGSKKC